MAHNYRNTDPPVSLLPTPQFRRSQRDETDLRPAGYHDPELRAAAMIARNPASSAALQIRPDDPAELTAKVSEILFVLGRLGSGSLRLHPEFANLVYVEFR